MRIDEARGSDNYRLVDGTWWYHSTGCGNGGRRRAHTGQCKRCGEAFVASTITAEFCSPSCRMHFAHAQGMRVRTPVKQQARTEEAWTFVALDPVGAWTPGELCPHTIRNSYPSEGAAIARLEDFAAKQGVSVRERIIKRARRLKDATVIRDCHFRWHRSGRIGYATIVKCQRDPGELVVEW